MNGRLLLGHVSHNRNQGPDNAIRYKVLYIDLELLGSAEGQPKQRLLGFNRFNLFSINDRDHYSDENGSFGTAIPRLINSENKGPIIESIRMITQPSMLGYAFNPVTFYLGTDGEQRTTMVVAEVHNHVGQRHIYVLHPYLSDGRSSAEFGKEFYVSPFLKMTGQYRISMKNGSDCLEFGFDLIQEGKCVLETKLNLIAKPLSSAENRSSYLLASIEVKDWRGTISESPETAREEKPCLKPIQSFGKVAACGSSVLQAALVLRSRT